MLAWDMCRRPASAGASLGRDTAKKATVPLRDETGRFAGVRPKTAAERSQVAKLLHMSSVKPLLHVMSHESWLVAVP